MDSENDKIAERYEKRKSNELVKKNSGSPLFMTFVQKEREKKYLQILRSRYGSCRDIRILEVGAGGGWNLITFLNAGAKPENIIASELLPERVQELKERLPEIKVYSGDACNLDPAECGTFDVVFQSTVFTSLLDERSKVMLADKMWELLNPGGLILWHDFIFDNPGNKDVKGIKKAEIFRLFPRGIDIRFYKVTLAPPIGRRINKLYPMFNFFPFLRSHLIAVIGKP